MRVHAYVSKIDGSLQPYRIVIPPGYDPASGGPIGSTSGVRPRRNSERGELHRAIRGPVHAARCVRLHPYGRYCNANKFAGEIDLLERWTTSRRRYRDRRRSDRDPRLFDGRGRLLAVRRPLPGLVRRRGTGCRVLRDARIPAGFQNEEVNPPWYEQKLWHLYDCTDYAVNLFNCPTVAYSGEMDRQKQAADIMATALQGRRDRPDAHHRARHRACLSPRRRRRRSTAGSIRSSARGRDPVPRGGAVHDVHAALQPSACGSGSTAWRSTGNGPASMPRSSTNTTVRVATRRTCRRLTLMPSRRLPAGTTRSDLTVQIDGQSLNAPPLHRTAPGLPSFHKVRRTAGTSVASADDGPCTSVPACKGPIDDAFMDSFVMVRPDGQAARPDSRQVGRSRNEARHRALAEAVPRRRPGQGRHRRHRRRHRRQNLVLWGDPSSNQVLAKIADKLPIRWQGDKVIVGDKTSRRRHRDAGLIYPNPLNPSRYVVLNSGFTFREYDYLNNARQVPKLPDWALINTSVPPTSRAPGEIVAAGFFGERWQLVDRP